MYKKNDKNRLLFNMCLFVLKKISINDFCDVFHDCYVIGEMTLSIDEEIILKGLSEKYIDRYTPYESDRVLYPKMFINEDDLVIGVQDALKSLSKSLDIIYSDMIDIINLLQKCKKNDDVGDGRGEIDRMSRFE